MTAFSPQNAEFDNFLFAPILDQDGLSLRVISALARQGIDPWQEAARLAQLPEDEAINSLATTIWKSDIAFLSPEQASLLAARLVKLLPATASARVVPSAAAEADLVVMWLAYGIFMGLVAVSGGPSQQPRHQDNTISALSLQETAPPQSIHAIKPSAVDAGGAR